MNETRTPIKRPKPVGLHPLEEILEPFSLTELRVLRAKARGRTNAEAGLELDPARPRAEATVRYHGDMLKRKLGATTHAQAIEIAYRRGLPLPKIGDELDPKSARLTRSETLVLWAVASGLTNEEAARSLKRSPETVKSHLKSMRRKLRARTREQIVARACALGLIPKSGHDYRERRFGAFRGLATC